MILVDGTFEMAHRVPEHTGGEDSIHGHTWTVELAISRIEDPSAELGGEPDEDEVILDPRYLKKLLDQRVIEVLDHCLMIWNRDEMAEVYKQFEAAGYLVMFTDFSPTAQNIARFIYNELEGELMREALHCEYVRIREGANISAMYMEQ